jgi:peptidoglycan-N-acetylglucosamine deacetylase
MVKITFSWDDGAREDLKLAELSKKYAIPGMFFIPEFNSERPVMDSILIKELNSDGFLIGAHTRSHVYLTKIDPGLVYDEVFQGKWFLENLLNIRIPHFCLPGGFYNSQILSISKQLFETIRSADTCYTKASFDLIKPTFHFFDRGLKSLIGNSLRGDIRILKYILHSKYRDNYFELIKDIIEKMHNSNDEFNVMIWGHSWEIQEFSLWRKLEDLFIFVNSNFKNRIVTYDQFLEKN